MKILGFITEFHGSTLRYVLKKKKKKKKKIELTKWVEYSPIVWETGIQSKVESYQRLKENGTWYCLA